MLDAVRKAGAGVQEIVLAPLGLDDVGRLVTDALRCEGESGNPLAQLVREQLPVFQKLIAPAGPLQSITFRAVGPGGADIYDVKYANATWEWRISMGSDGKVVGLFGRPAP